MKIALPTESKQKLGGGFSFLKNLTAGLLAEGVEVVDWKKADVVLIVGPTIITKRLFQEIKDSGKKIVVRLDNIVRNSRNRGAGMSRMVKMARNADKVVFQSSWSKGLLSPFLLVDGPIIHNSVNEGIFRPEGPSIDFSMKGNPIYLYSRFSRDELKRWEKVYYDFIKISQDNKDAFLAIIGRFSDDLRKYNFDFYADEKYEYKGIINDAEYMARMYRGADYLMAPYFQDCFSNSYIESLMCGCELYDPELSGGTEEMINLWREKGREYFSLKRMTLDYLNVLNNDG